MIKIEQEYTTPARAPFPFKMVKGERGLGDGRVDDVVVDVDVDAVDAVVDVCWVCLFTSFFLPSPPSPLLSLLLLLSLSPPLGKYHCCFSPNEIPNVKMWLFACTCMRRDKLIKKSCFTFLPLRFLPWIYLSLTSKSADYKSKRFCVSVMSCLVDIFVGVKCVFECRESYCLTS